MPKTFESRISTSRENSKSVFEGFKVQVTKERVCSAKPQICQALWHFNCNRYKVKLHILWYLLNFDFPSSVYLEFCNCFFFFRMNLLSMTFGKYIDANLCCFIPGKIIDEIYNVLGILKTKCDPPSTYEVLQVWATFYKHTYLLIPFSK